MQCKIRFSSFIKVEISAANHMYTSCLGLIRSSMRGPDIVIIFQRLMSYSIPLLVETEIHKCAQHRLTH